MSQINDDEEMKELSVKLQDGTATKDEVAKFLQIVNGLLSTLKIELEGLKK